MIVTQRFCLCGVYLYAYPFEGDRGINDDRHCGFADTNLQIVQRASSARSRWLPRTARAGVIVTDSVGPVTFLCNRTFYLMRSMIHDSYINRKGSHMRITDIIKTDRSIWRRWSFVVGVMRREKIALLV